MLALYKLTPPSPSQFTMQSLLRWSIENSTPDSSASARSQMPVDTSLIDYILGPSPAQQMEDALAVAADDTVEEGEDEDEEDEDRSNRSGGTRMQALANLEMVRSYWSIYWEMLMASTSLRIACARH